MMFSSQIDAFSPSQFTPSQNAAADSTTPSKFRGASGTTPLTVKQIADAQLAGAGEKGAPFAVDGVETASIRLVGTVSGKAERATDMSFTLDDGTGRIDFIRWAPMVLTKSKGVLQRKSEFLVSEVGLELAYIAGQPVILCLSLEGRLRPRYNVVKFLKANGLLESEWTYYTIFKVTEKVFVEKFICPHKEAAPHLAEDYDAACRGEVPTNFRST